MQFLKNLLMKQKNNLLILILILFSSCSSLKPINSEYNLIRTFSNINLNEYGNGKILIYNGSTFFHKSDDTSNLNVWINGKALGQIRANEYALLYLLPGKYEFRIQHKDVANFENSQTVLIDNKTSVISIKPTITSNKIEITNQLPLGINNYRNVLN